MVVWDGFPEQKRGRDDAIVCTNGHVINDHAIDHPEGNFSHCLECGAPGIRQCQECKAPIKGSYFRTGGGFRSPDAYCHNCGKPYPWTEARLISANELIDLAEKLSSEEKEILKTDISSLLCNTPRTQVAVTRLKLSLPRLGKEISAGLYQLLVDVASETVKKMIQS